MKTLLFGLSLAISCTLPSWSAEIRTQPDIMERQIVLESQSIDAQDLMKRYEAEKLDPQQAAFTNVLPFGVGSFQQGDTLGGVLITAVDIAALGLMGYGLSSGNGWGAIIGLGWGLPVYGIGRIIGVISPYMHANAYNTELRKQLGSDTLNIGSTETNIYTRPTFSLGYTF